MDALTFCDDAIGHVLSWPVAVVAVALIFRGKIESLLDRLRSYDGKWGRLDFGDHVKKAETAVNDAAGILNASPAGMSLTHSLDPVEGKFVQLATQASANASYATVAAWDLLIESLRDRGIGATQAAGRLSPPQVVDGLRNTPGLPAELASAADQLRLLRNEVAHGKVQPSEGEAVAFVMVASKVYDAVKGAT